MTLPAPDTVAALLANRRYALYLASRVALILATQMVSVAVGWQVYEITGTALALGFSGLALFLPGFFLALPSGHVADRHDRRRILATCHVGVTLAAVAQRLDLSARSLQRRLEREGFNLRSLIDDVRRVEYARLESTLTQAAIAERLGFVDASALRKARKRWEQSTRDKLS